MPYLTREALLDLGFHTLGMDVSISTLASLHNPGGMAIADHVRIDDFSVLSAGVGGLVLGRNVHIAPHCVLVGAGRISLGDFAGLSSRVSIYSSSDDYSGRAMTNPTVPPEFTAVDSRDITLGRHAIVGCGSVLLPGAQLEDGVAVGALSVVTKRCEAFGIYWGNPARRIGERDRKLLTVEQHYLIGDKAP